MKICVIHLGSSGDCFVASSINKGLCKKYNNPSISWVAKDPAAQQLLQHSDTVSEVIEPGEMDADTEFDLIINLSPAVHPSDPFLKAKEFLGFNFSDTSSDMYDVIYGQKKVKINLFQVYYRLANLSWRGEGYDVKYYPKSRQKSSTAGISVDHIRLRHYVEDKLELDNMKAKVLPYRKNIFKRMDEINRCEHIVTDDWLTMHLAIYLRKYVHFLELIPINTKPEFFGRGQVYRVPNVVIK